MTKKGKSIEIEYWLQSIFCNPGGIVVRPHRSSLAPKKLLLNATNMYLMRQNCFKLVSAITFLFCMINYSQKMLINRGFIASKKLL